MIYPTDTAYDAKSENGPEVISGQQAGSVMSQSPLDVICFGGEDWWYHNRGHIDMQLARRFARRGTTVYINSIVMQKPTLKRATGGGKSFSQKLVRKAKSIMRGVRRTDAGFWAFSPLSLPVHHNRWLRPINSSLLSAQIGIMSRRLGIRRPLVWVACPAACELAIRMDKVALVYQRTDRMEEYPNVDGQTIRQYDQVLKKHADLTLFVNRSLYDQEQNQCRKAMYLDHGVDFELFGAGEGNASVPEEMKDLKGPIVGFFGGIDNHTSDIPFWEKLVALMPECTFVLVGRASSDVSELECKPNVRLLGQKPYEDIPKYGRCFDVAIMVWHQNEWIQGCNPIKLKEYLALGKPVVSTPFPQLEYFNDVTYQGATPEQFAESIRRALSENNLERVQARRDKIKDDTWDSKAELVFQELSL